MTTVSRAKAARTRPARGPGVPAAAVPRTPREIRADVAALVAGAGRSGGGRASTASLARRTQIITAAIQVIARDGIRGCTVTALERETGFARGHFSYHFSSKEEIIGLAFAAVGSDWATTQVAAAVGDTARQRLERHVRAAVTWVQQRPDYFRCLMNFRVEMMRDQEAFPPAAQIRRQMWEACAQMIREGTTEGAFHPRADGLVEAKAMFATIDGFLMYHTMDATFCADESLADRVWRTVAERLGAAG